jgi:DNA polymerase/3'-5' exonuclease PolX
MFSECPKAIKSISACKNAINNGEEAKQLNGVGPFIASKIDIILKSGSASVSPAAPASSSSSQPVVYGTV